MGTPTHRHQDSLEEILNFSSSPPLGDSLRHHAEVRFYAILHHYDDRDPDVKSKYNRPRLVRLLYDEAIEPKSKDNVLRAFFLAMKLPMDGPPLEDFSASMLTNLLGFADHLVHNFFLPLLASTAKTPQPTPEYRSATMRETSEGFVGTPARLPGLRGDCLVRDKHRCVISRVFDRDMARERIAPDGQVVDDDGQTIAPGDFGHLEVAHILPHSFLVKIESKSEQLDETRKTALEILNMFDNDVAHLINGVEIDRPRNALTLTHDLHQDFGRFDIYFTADHSQPHTYLIETFLSTQLHPAFPITRTLSLTTDRNIEPPSPRLLAVHRAIAMILHFSAAGEYIHKILRGMEEQTARCDGSTSLGDFVQLRMENLLVI